MGEKTGISWTDHTFNPWIGCTKVGPGCDHCYAEARDARRQWDGGKVHWGAGVPRYRTSASNWEDVNRWNRKAAAAGISRRVFCASLADVFDNEAPQAWRNDLWRLVMQARALSWLLVTKRIGNVPRMVPPAWMDHGFPNHVRLLITVVNQEEADRDIPKLLRLPCKNGISYEPALGPIDFTAIPRIDPEHPHPPHYDMADLEWIIVGGESRQGGAKARPFDIGWAHSTIEQCKAAGVPAFVKQLGSNVEWNDTDPENSEPPHWLKYEFKDRAASDPDEWAPALRIQQFPT